jgi:hypothetical protein
MALQMKQVTPHRKMQKSANESSLIYEPLKLSPERKEIRLLRLSPGSTGVSSVAWFFYSSLC